jgi:PadR family transcriptional regulator, regulatory protein PadR
VEVSVERSSQLLRGVLDLCLLALMSERACYGYEIVRQLEARGLSLVAEGSVYPALSRLEGAGLIEGYWERSADGPRRKYYRLLPAGRRQLDSWADEWEVFRDGVDAIVAAGVVRSGS